MPKLFLILTMLVLNMERKVHQNLNLHMNTFVCGRAVYERTQASTVHFSIFPEANPQKFNSRLRNKMFYGQAGGKDLLQRKWKDLCEMCTLECDGKDLTPLLKEHRVHAVVFLNIPR